MGVIVIVVCFGIRGTTMVTRLIWFDYVAIAHSVGIFLWHHIKPFLSHQSAYVVLLFLLSLWCAFMNRNLISKRLPCCCCMRRCLVLSDGLKNPLASIMTPLGKIKSGVYTASFVYWIRKVSYSKSTPSLFSERAVSLSNLDLKRDTRRVIRFFACLICFLELERFSDKPPIDFIEAHRFSIWSTGAGILH